MYDLIIIGGGPAGFTASIYGSRYRVKNLVLGKLKGGTIGLANRVENYPGFASISGLELMKKIEEHAKGLGAEVVYDSVQGIKKEGEVFKVFTELGKEYEAKSLILATGTERRKLGITGEEEFLGRGVSYCTTCDAVFYQDKTVALVGGADAAVSGAVHTAEYAKKVYIIYRKEELRAEPIWVEQALGNPKIEVIYKTNVVEIKGGEAVTGVVLDQPYKGSKELALEGVFIEIGGVPGTSLAKAMGVELNETGYVKVDKAMKTNLKGVFAAGDMTDFLPRFQQMITAQGMGAIAAASAYEYLKQETAPPQRGG